MTDRSGIDHVLDAIDNALWDWAESPDAMTVRYSVNGGSGPETLAESPGHTQVGSEAGVPSSVLPATNVIISARGIEWVNADGEVVRSLPLVVDPEMPPDEIRVAPRPPFWIRRASRPLPEWHIDWNARRPPPVPQINVEGIREALRNIAPPRWPQQAPTLATLDEAMRNLAASLQPVGQQTAASVNALGQAVMQIRDQFKLLALQAPQNLHPALEKVHEATARQRALDARQNRHTGPARNPHRHRGI